MNRIGPRIILACSVLIAVAVIFVWSNDQSADPRSDLAGDSVTTAPTTRPERVTTTPRATPPPSSTTVPIGPSFPERLSIPSLGVDAVVVSVGLEPNGSMEVPGATEAGWYQYGSVPGDAAGSAVIAAHVDYNRKPGVFFELRRLDVGAGVDITDSAGAVHSFVVSERFQVDKQALPTGELFRTSGAPTLTLITCGGGFDEGARSYSDNIVVRAVPA